MSLGLFERPTRAEQAKARRHFFSLAGIVVTLSFMFAAAWDVMFGAPRSIHLLTVIVLFLFGALIGISIAAFLLIGLSSLLWEAFGPTAPEPEEASK